MKLYTLKKYLFFSLFLFIASCAYYNTFFNAKARYDKAEQEQKKNKSKTVSNAAKKNYNDAITKCWKLIDFYGDSSTYADDALLMIGKSYYHLEEYDKSERVLQQFLENYDNSEFIPDAKLWLARTYIEQEKDDEALTELDNISQYKISKEIAAESFYILGDLHYKREKYEEAIDNFLKSTDLTRDDEKEGRAYFYIGESFFAQNEYENAISNYDRVNKLDVPVLLEFEALIQKINALLELKRFEDATDELEYMLSDNRFKEYFSLIETKLALISELEDNNNYAMERYLEIIKNYPKTEGAALAAFYIGQLYEYEIGQFDSAKVYYDKVRVIYAKSEASIDAAERSKMIAGYIKIRDKLTKDISDHRRLMQGDSSLVDSVEIAGEDEQSENNEDTDKIEPDDNYNNKNQFDSFAEDGSKSVQDSTDVLRDKKPARKTKAVVSRDPNVVYTSLVKNMYGLGEFFLLKYQHEDSAKAVFQQFINNYQDSILTPKAYYALYYIYKNNENTSYRADSLKIIIINDYAYSDYAKRFLNENTDGKSTKTLNTSDSLASALYHEAENLLEAEDYYTAIERLDSITTLDSTSIWAAKSRYAIAYIYEYHLDDIPGAIESYTIIAKSYSKSEFGKIAENKIKEPPPEVVPAIIDSTGTKFPDNGMSVSDSTLGNPGIDNVIAPVEETPIDEVRRAIERAQKPGLSDKEEMPKEK